MEGEDARTERRGRTLKTGKVWFNKNRSVMDCQIRNMSDTGALVRFQIPFKCPDRVALYMPLDEKEGNIRGCETMWVRNTDAGFHFLSKPQLVKLDDIEKYKMDGDWMSSTWVPI